MIDLVALNSFKTLYFVEFYLINLIVEQESEFFFILTDILFMFLGKITIIYQKDRSDEHNYNSFIESDKLLYLREKFCTKRLIM